MLIDTVTRHSCRLDTVLLRWSRRSRQTEHGSKRPYPRGQRSNEAHDYHRRRPTHHGYAHFSARRYGIASTAQRHDLLSVAGLIRLLHLESGGLAHGWWGSASLLGTTFQHTNIT